MWVYCVNPSQIIIVTLYFVLIDHNIPFTLVSKESSMENVCFIIIVCIYMCDCAQCVD